MSAEQLIDPSPFPSHVSECDVRSLGSSASQRASGDANKYADSDSSRSNNGEEAASPSLAGMNVFTNIPPAVQRSPPEEKRARLRASQACEVCRVRKRKCSGQKPVCGRCRERGLECIWSDVAPHRHHRHRASTKHMPSLTPLKIPQHDVSPPSQSSSTSSSFAQLPSKFDLSDYSSQESPLPPFSASSNACSVESERSSQFWGNAPYQLVDAPPRDQNAFQTKSTKPFLNSMLPVAINPESVHPAAPFYPFSSSPISIDTSTNGYPFSLPSDFDCAFTASDISINHTKRSPYTSICSDSSTGSFPPSSNDSLLGPVSPSIAPPLSMPSPVQAGSFANAPAWLEILDPVVGSFLNPTPMFDSSCNPSSQSNKDGRSDDIHSMAVDFPNIAFFTQ